MDEKVFEENKVTINRLLSERYPNVRVEWGESSEILLEFDLKPDEEAPSIETMMDACSLATELVKLYHGEDVEFYPDDRYVVNK